MSNGSLQSTSKVTTKHCEKLRYSEIFQLILQQVFQHQFPPSRRLLPPPSQTCRLPGQAAVERVVHRARGPTAMAATDSGGQSTQYPQTTVGHQFPAVVQRWRREETVACGCRCPGAQRCRIGVSAHETEGGSADGGAGSRVRPIQPDVKEESKSDSVGDGEDG